MLIILKVKKKKINKIITPIFLFLKINNTLIKKKKHNVDTNHFLTLK